MTATPNNVPTRRLKTPWGEYDVPVQPNAPTQPDVPAQPQPSVPAQPTPTQAAPQGEFTAPPQSMMARAGGLYNDVVNRIGDGLNQGYQWWNGLDPRYRGAATYGGVGAGLGALLGGNNRWLSALLGGGLGAGGKWLYDNHGEAIGKGLSDLFNSFSNKETKSASEAGSPSTPLGGRGLANRQATQASFRPLPTQKKTLSQL